MTTYQIKEETALACVGHPYYQKQVLEAWGYIELDEPLLKRRHAIEASVSRGECFWNIHVALAFLARTLQPKSYLEIGTRTGGSLCQVLLNSRVDRFVSVDLWNGGYASLSNTLEYTKEQIDRLCRLSGRQIVGAFVQGDSHNTLKSSPYLKRRFPLITVDGDHSAEGAWEDLTDVVPLLEDAGAIVFDDIIHPSHKDLLDVVRRFVGEFPEFSVVLNTTQDNGCAIFTRNIRLEALFPSNPGLRASVERSPCVG